MLHIRMQHFLTMGIAAALLSGPCAVWIFGCAERHPHPATAPGTASSAAPQATATHIGPDGGPAREGKSSAFQPPMMLFPQMPTVSLGPRGPLPPELEENTQPLPGPPCLAGGPSIRVKVSGLIPGKPPMADLAVTIQINNPLKRKVWFVYEHGGELPVAVSGVAIRRADFGSLRQNVDPVEIPPDIEPLPDAIASEGFLWEIFTDLGMTKGLLMLPGAEVTLLDLRLSARRSTKRVVVYFADSITIGAKSASAWLGHAGVAPKRGAFYMDSLDVVHARDADQANKPLMNLQVLCVHSISTEVEVR